MNTIDSLGQLIAYATGGPQIKSKGKSKAKGKPKEEDEDGSKFFLRLYASAEGILTVHEETWPHRDPRNPSRQTGWAGVGEEGYRSRVYPYPEARPWVKMALYRDIYPRDREKHGIEQP